MKRRNADTQKRYAELNIAECRNERNETLGERLVGSLVSLLIEWVSQIGPSLSFHCRYRFHSHPSLPATLLLLLLLLMMMRVRATENQKSTQRALVPLLVLLMLLLMWTVACDQVAYQQQ